MTTPTIHDVLIIGAGPAGLAVAARLRERTPSSLFSDAEHDRFQRIKHHSATTTRTSCTETISIQVLDSSGPSWLRSWRNNFRALAISHLRSPMFFHPCPRDRDGLLAFARETGRDGDCVEVADCAGTVRLKHRVKKNKREMRREAGGSGAVLEIDERDRKDYYTPSSAVFEDYCDSVAARYDLEHCVEEAKVTMVDYGAYDGVCGDTTRNLFRVGTGDDAVRFARVVILAIGPGGSPSMPWNLSAAECEGACHSTQLSNRPFLARHVRQKILAKEPTAVVIVGGGLTAAQIANRCIENGVSHVFMIMRSALKLKPFDIPLHWLAKYRNVQKAAFYSADSDEERLKIILEARNGGSIPPLFNQKLQAHIAHGALSIHTHTSITSQTWSPHQRLWHLSTSPSIPSFQCTVDYIYYATGITPSVSALPLLSPIMAQHPIGTCGGLPCLTEDLAWKEEVPLFVAGRLAGLRIGPDAANLSGARTGAERICDAVREWLQREGKAGREEESAEGDYYSLCCQRVGAGNMFEALEEEE